MPLPSAAMARIVSGKNLSIALTQDIVNNGEVAANGSLSYTTTGSFTNNGKLLAGQTLTVGGSNVDNTAGAEMSGIDTVVNASGTLTNRGLIDSQGKTQINAGVAEQHRHRTYLRRRVSIGAGTLKNDAETINGVTKAGHHRCARHPRHRRRHCQQPRARADLQQRPRRRCMKIGASLDANRSAIGKAPCSTT
jgi:filamentous hemagglutinin